MISGKRKCLLITTVVCCCRFWGWKFGHKRYDVLVSMPVPSFVRILFSLVERYLQYACQFLKITEDGKHFNCNSIDNNDAVTVYIVYINKLSLRVLHCEFGYTTSPVFKELVLCMLFLGVVCRYDEPICQSSQSSSFSSLNNRFAGNWYLFHGVVLCVRSNVNQIYARHFEGTNRFICRFSFYGIWRSFPAALGWNLRIAIWKQVRCIFCSPWFAYDQFDHCYNYCKFCVCLYVGLVRKNGMYAAASIETPNWRTSVCFVFRMLIVMLAVKHSFCFVVHNA